MKNTICLIILAIYGTTFFFLGCDYTKRNEKRITIERIIYSDKPTPVFLPLPKKTKIQNDINILASAIDAKKLGLKK